MKKWLLFIIEQLLSNAVKYTPGRRNSDDHSRRQKAACRSRTQESASPGKICRVFLRRDIRAITDGLDKKSTGIGLYLCRTAADKLGHRLLAQSEPGKGSRFIVDLDMYPFQAE